MQQFLQLFLRKMNITYLMYIICLRNLKSGKFSPKISLIQNRILLGLQKPNLQAKHDTMFHCIRKCLYASLICLVKTVECTETSVALTILDKESRDPQEKDLTYIIQSDEYFKLGNYEDSYKVLQYFDGHENAEILWRMARCLYNMSKLKNVEHSEQVKMIEEAYELVTRALTLDENNAAVHKWMAILLDTKCTHEGITSRLKALPDFKKHLLRSLELNPKDATSMYILGQYCYNIASMPWYQRKIASTLFATPPEATFEEALHYFVKAEEIEPNFYSLNLLMLGKTYLQLKKIEAAHYWLKCASSYPIRTEEDKQVRKEAEELLQKHGMKYDNNSFGGGGKAKGNE